MPKEFFIELATKFGVPAVIALFLVWFVTSNLTAKVDQHIHDTRGEHHQTVDLLRAICFNTADSPAEFARCQ